MKNKNPRNDKKGQQKTLKTSIPTLETKNRNKLRKKLKNLLDNNNITLIKKSTQPDTTSVVQESHSNSVSRKKTIKTKSNANQNGEVTKGSGVLLKKPTKKVVSKKVNDESSNETPSSTPKLLQPKIVKKQKKKKAKENLSQKLPKQKTQHRSESDSFNAPSKKKIHQNLSESDSPNVPSHIKIPLKLAESDAPSVLSGKKVSKIKENGTTMKRKLKTKTHTMKKTRKLEDSPECNDNIAPKKNKKQKNTPMLDEEKNTPKTSNKKTKKGRLVQGVETTKKVKKETTPKSEPNLTLKKSTKKVKRAIDKKPKSKFMAPNFDESEAEQSLTPSRSESSQENLNTEQALMRVKDKSPSLSSDDETFDIEKYSECSYEYSNSDSLPECSYEHSNSGCSYGYSNSECSYEYSHSDSDDQMSHSMDEVHLNGDFVGEDYNSEDDDDYYVDEDRDFYDEDDDDDFAEYHTDFSDDDTYEPPGDTPEDVYIASGTAITHDLSLNNEVDFDSDTSSAQIIELPLDRGNNKARKHEFDQKKIKPKPNAEKIKDMKQNETELNDDADSDDSCPELVPIDDPSDFSDYSSDYSESFSESSTSCSSISVKKFNKQISEEKRPQMIPEIITATSQHQNTIEDIFANQNYLPQKNTTATSLIEEFDKSTEKNTSSYKVYTTNNEILSNDSLANKPSETNLPKPEIIKSSSPRNETKIVEQVPSASPYLEKDAVKGKAEVINEKLTVVPTPDQTPIKIPQTTSAVKEKAELINEKPTAVKTSIKTPQTTPKKASKSKPIVRTLFYNAINSNQVLVLLKDPLYLYGTVKLKLLAGSVEVFGHNPKRNEMVELFSPRGYSFLKIEASSHASVDETVNEKEILSLSPYFIRSDLEEILQKFETNKDAILILERNDRSKKINMLKKYMVEHLFPNMNSIQSNRPFYTSEFLLRCILTTDSDNHLYIDPRWRAISINSNSRVMAIGGKAVGKSSLLRYLVNKNLNKYPKILLVDLDIGQPEMFVPQTVSATTLTAPLLGPGYFLNKQPDKAFLVGNVNIVLSPERYIQCVQALLEYCNSHVEYKDIPWVVNTMGYNKGFGDELMAVICSFLQPTNIIQLESQREINNFDFIMSKHNLKSVKMDIIGDMFESNDDFNPQHQFTLLQSVIPERTYQKEGAMKPRDMRMAMIISRLSDILTGHAEWLTDVKPVCASTDDLNIINLGEDQINKEEMLKTLVGNLVYLCHEEAGKAVECFGIGIVRGIDYPLKQIYLLPAVPIALLQNVNCLAICGIPLPSSILINQGPKVKGVATYVYNTLDEASSMHIKQIYNRPKHFLTGRRKSVYQ